jgi:tetraacyldisaccharide 4'-kinase
MRPVVSVGNLTTGGRGKTPTVAWLARMLVEAGERPAILSRGYARRNPDEGVTVVSDGVHLLADLARSGDEPLLLARDVPGAAVFVCDDRALAGTVAERAFGATVHLLDDGFQHVQLARDVDLVVVGASDFLDRPMPFGRLREPVQALEAADAVIMDGAGADDATCEGRTPTFLLRRSLGRPVPLEPDRPWPGDAHPVVAVAGIAEPGRFPRALEAAGWTVARTLTFADHHAYTRGDLERIVRIASKVGAVGIVTTAKDAMRLLPLRPLSMPVAYVPLDVSIEPVSTFRPWFFDELRKARA